MNKQIIKEQQYVAPEVEMLQISINGALLESQLPTITCTPPDEEQCWTADEG